jgi:glucan phosphoethanolaminetransferase (alkaline phosphatase superfamily)
MYRCAFQTSIQGECIGIPFLASRPKRRIVMSSVLLYSYLLLRDWQHLFESQQASEKRAMTVYLLGGSIAVLVAAVIVIALIVTRIKSAQRRKALEQLIEMYRQSGLALVRYVMLNRQCSEEVAYQRIAAFVKSYVPFDEHSSIDRMLAHDRQSLVERALSILVYDQDAIDKI